MLASGHHSQVGTSHRINKLRRHYLLCSSCLQLAAALPGRSPEECEALCQQYQTVLEQPHDPSHEAEFVAVVKGIHKMTGDIDAVSVRHWHVTCREGGLASWLRHLL